MSKETMSVITNIHTDIYNNLKAGYIPWDLPDFGVHAINYITGIPMKNLNMYFLKEGEYVPARLLGNLGHSTTKGSSSIITVDFTGGRGPENPVEVYHLDNTSITERKWDTSVYNEHFLKDLGVNLGLSDTPIKVLDDFIVALEEQLMHSLFELLELGDTYTLSTFKVSEEAYDYRIVVQLVIKVLLSMGGVNYTVKDSEEIVNYFLDNSIEVMISCIYLAGALLRVIEGFAPPPTPKLIEVQQVQSKIESFKVEGNEFEDENSYMSERYQRLLHILCDKLEREFYGKVIIPDSPALYDRVLKVIQGFKEYPELIHCVVTENISTSQWDNLIPEKSLHLKALRPFILEELFKLQYGEIYAPLTVLVDKVRDNMGREIPFKEGVLDCEEFYKVSVLTLNNNLLPSQLRENIPRYSKYFDAIQPVLEDHRDIVTKWEGLVINNDNLKVFGLITQSISAWGGSVEHFKKLHPFYKAQLMIKTPKDEKLLMGAVNYINQLLQEKGIVYDVNMDDFISYYYVYFNFDVLYST